MAADASSNAHLANGTDRDSKTEELALTLPLSPEVKINIRLTVSSKSVMLFLTSTELGTSGAAALGSFVYAMPDRYNPTQPMSTALYSSAASLDFATRMAKVLARRLQKPCYVGSSINLSVAAGGGSVDEEMEAFRGVVDAVLARAASS